MYTYHVIQPFLSGIYQKKEKSEVPMYTDVPSSFACNSQKFETIQMSINRQMGKNENNLWHSHATEHCADTEPSCTE